MLIFLILLLFFTIHSAHSEYIYLTTTGVNLRKGPDNKKRVLRTVPGNKTIEILEKTNEWWWKVEYEGTQGYIAKDFIKISYPLSFISFAKNQPIPTGALIILIFGILYYLSSLGSNAKPSPKKKKKPIK